MIKTTKEDLLNVMKKAARIASGRAMNPVLNHVAIKSDGSRMTITASDSTCSYSESITCDGSPCEFTLEAQKLLKSLSAMKSGDVELEPGQAKQGKTKIKLETLSYDQFPKPNLEKAEKTDLTCFDLLDCFAVVSHAMAIKDVRIMLRGVHLTESYCVATDGLRMATTKCNYSGPDIIIPSDTVKNMPDIDGDVLVSQNHIVIQGENSIFSSSLLDAKFPDWRRIIPDSANVEVNVSKPDILDAIKVAQIGGDMIKLSITDSKAVITSANAETEIPVKSSGSIEIGFMYNLLLDAVNQCGDDVCLKMSAGRACVVNDQFYVMPVRL